MEQTKKNGKKFFKVLSIISNIIFIPIVIIVLVVSILLYSAKRNNEVPSLFGYSVVKILTSSMSKDVITGQEQPQFAKDQFVIVKVVNTKSLNVGDIIAFYDYMDSDVDKSTLESNKETSSNNTASSNTSTGIISGATNDNQKRVAPYSRVLFHRIVAISTPLNSEDPNYGKLFFQTKGDANTYTDANWIMEDFVVGEYHSNNAFICGLFSFCTSQVGSIVLIIIPSLIVIGFLTFNIIGQSKEVRKKDNSLSNKEQEEILQQVSNSDKYLKKKEKEEEQKKLAEKDKMLNEILGEAKSNEMQQQVAHKKEESKQEPSKEDGEKHQNISNKKQPSANLPNKNIEAKPQSKTPNEQKTTVPKAPVKKVPTAPKKVPAKVPPKKQQ